MPYESTAAFVIGAQPIQEQDKLVVLLTAEKGIIKGFAPGALRNRNRFGSVFELLTQGDFVYYWKESSELVTISKGDIIRSYFNLVSNSEHVFYFYFMTEVLIKLIPQQQKDKRIYRLLSAVMDAIENGCSVFSVCQYLMIWLLRIEGLMFDPSLCYSCSKNNLSHSWVKNNFKGTLCNSCRTNEFFSLQPKDIAFIIWSESHAPQEINSIEIPDNLWLIKMLKDKIEYHSECTIKSAHYLKEFSQ
jgi:DNA repair protein RecO